MQVPAVDSGMITRYHAASDAEKAAILKDGLEKALKITVAVNPPVRNMTYVRFQNDIGTFRASLQAFNKCVPSVISDLSRPSIDKQCEIVADQIDRLFRSYNTPHGQGEYKAFIFPILVELKKVLATSQSQNQTVLTADLICSTQVHSAFLEALHDVKEKFSQYKVSCYISFYGEKYGDIAKLVCKHLKQAGITVSTTDDLPTLCNDVAALGVAASSSSSTTALDSTIRTNDYVLVLGTKEYVNETKNPASPLCQESLFILERHRVQPQCVLKALLDGAVIDSFPPGLNNAIVTPAYLNTQQTYFSETLRIVQALYWQYIENDQDKKKYIEEKISAIQALERKK